jgi:hypothetical protein
LVPAGYTAPGRVSDRPGNIPLPGRLSARGRGLLCLWIRHGPGGEPPQGRGNGDRIHLQDAQGQSVVPGRFRSRGFVLSSTSSVMPEVPHANIDAMFQHGKKFGAEFLSR